MVLLSAIWHLNSVPLTLISCFIALINSFTGLNAINGSKNIRNCHIIRWIVWCYAKKMYTNKVDTKNRNQIVSVIRRLEFSRVPLTFWHYLLYVIFPVLDVGSVKKSCDNFSLIQLILKLIPVLKWLPKYSLKHDLPGDISSGITVAVMHIPQGKHFLNSTCRQMENCNKFISLLFLWKS